MVTAPENIFPASKDKLESHQKHGAKDGAFLSKYDINWYAVSVQGCISSSEERVRQEQVLLLNFLPTFPGSAAATKTQARQWWKEYAWSDNQSSRCYCEDVEQFTVPNWRKRTDPGRKSKLFENPLPKRCYTWQAEGGEGKTSVGT